MPTVSNAPESAAFTHRDVLVVISGILLGMFLAALDQTIVASALPTIAGELKGVEHLSWIVAAYLLTSTATTPIYGKLSDLYGRRVILEIAIVIFLAASALCALAQSMPQLIVARALQGLGGGGLITLAQATIADVISPRDRGRYQAYFSGIWAVASVGGPVLGGIFADYLSWRWVFWINLPIGAVALVLCHHALKRLRVKRTRRPIDYLGATLLMAAVTSLLLVATWGGSELPWTSPTILGLAAAGLLLLGLFGLQELRAGEPMLPLRLFGNPVILVANTVSFIASMALFEATVLLPVFLQFVNGASAAHSGILIAPLMGGTVVGAYSAGQIMGRTGRYKWLPLTGLGVTTIAYGLLQTLGAGSPPILAMAYMGMIGIGLGMVMPVMLVGVQNAAETRDIGVATSSVAFFRSMGGSFGVAAVWSVLIYALNGRAALQGLSGIDILRRGPEAIAALPAEGHAAIIATLTHAFHVAFLVGAGFAAAALAVTLMLREIPLRTSPAAARDEAGATAAEARNRRLVRQALQDMAH